jgi:methylmalonyl-CoA/ethylmalonyl-CoA epimerase
LKETKALKIHHIGYLVDNIENATSEFERLGFIKIGEVTEDSSREIFIVFLDNDGVLVELIQPISETSPVYGLRKKYRNSPYHICYKTQDLQSKIENMANSKQGGGYTIVQPPMPAPAIPGCPSVAFLMNRDIGMIEIVNMENSE